MLCSTTCWCICIHIGDHQLSNNPSLITVHTTSTENSVCATCFIDSSSNGTCLLVAHPKPSLLHSQGGLSNIDVLLLNRSGNHSASGCIRGISHTSHVIAAFLYDETQVIQGPAFVVRPQGTYIIKAEFIIIHRALNKLLIQTQMQH